MVSIDEEAKNYCLTGIVILYTKAFANSPSQKMMPLMHTPIQSYLPLKALPGDPSKGALPLKPGFSKFFITNALT